MPSRLMCRVRGIGVAESVSTSTVDRKVFSHSLSSTPNRCSSSMTTRPRSLKATSFCRMRWVPIRMSTPPAAARLRTSRISALGPEPVDDLDNERKLGHPRREAAMVLLGQDRGRHQHGDLLAGVDGLEGRADGDLGLAVADVAADQAVHRLLSAMSRLTASIAASWSGVSSIRKGGLELGHPVAVLGGIGKPRLAGALGLDVEQLLGQVDDGLGHPLLPLLPGRRADLRERRLRLAAADVLLHQVDLGDRHVQLGSLGKLEEQGLLGVLGRLVDEVQAAIPGDAVVDVDDQVALVQVEEAVDGPALVPPPGDRAADVGAREELVVADHEGRGVDQVEARPDPADGQMKPARSRQLGVGEDLAQPLDLGRVVAGDQDAFAGRGAIELGLDLGQLAREPLDALDPQVAGRFERIGRQRRDRDRREPDQPLEAALDGVEPARVVDPAEVVPALLAQVARLDQGDPGAARERSRPDGRSWPDLLVEAERPRSG